MKSNSFEEYIKNFEYESYISLKADGYQVLEKIVNKEDILVLDVRFREEYEMWRVPFIKNVPMKELPEFVKGLKKDQLIVTACPHKDRSIIAAHYLIYRGFTNVKYLNDGLLKMAEHLSGEEGIVFYERLNDKV